MEISVHVFAICEREGERACQWILMERQCESPFVLPLIVIVERPVLLQCGESNSTQRRCFCMHIQIVVYKDYLRTWVKHRLRFRRNREREMSEKLREVGGKRWVRTHVLSTEGASSELRVALHQAYLPIRLYVQQSCHTKVGNTLARHTRFFPVRE